MENNLFASVIGYDEIKLELARVLDQLRDPEKYAALGVTAPHGLLLYGDPGVGKSTIAREFIEASGRRSFSCRKDKPNGDFVKEIVRVFDEAVNTAPSIVLLDDLDKFANVDEACCDAEEFVTVQACIDRVKDKAVFVVATVNNMHKLPRSLTRAGRFDHVLKIHCPIGRDAQAIVAHYLAQKPFMADVDVFRIARLLEGRSCAELETVINQAAAYAGFEDRQQVEMKDMIKAILRVVFQAPESFKANEACLPLVACHEAGHALVAELLEPDSVDLVTVLNHDSDEAGVTALYRAQEYFYSKELMEVRVMCLLAGKAATEICFGVVDPGVNSDMGRAFNIVRRFVDEYCSHGFDQFVFAGSEVSDGLLDRRDARIASDMTQYYNRVRRLLIDNKPKLDALREQLLLKKTLLGDEVQAILKSA